MTYCIGEFDTGAVPIIFAIDLGRHGKLGGTDALAMMCADVIGCSRLSK